MNCADLEILLCDYLDGMLTPAQRSEVERHLEACPGCAELARDAQSAVGFMARAADVEPPAELITRILFDPPWAKSKARRSGALRQWLGGLLEPVLQPKLAMSMALTILSFSIFARFTPVRQLTAADLQPSRVLASIEDRGIRAWERTVKFYENLRFVYQIQSTLREWQQQQDEEQRAAAAAEERAPADEHKIPIRKTAPQEAPQGTRSR